MAIKRFGQSVIHGVQNVGLMTLFTLTVLRLFFRWKIRFKNVFEQMLVLGVNSLPITLISATFVGMAFAVQVVREFVKFGATELIGGIVGIAVWRELGPLLTGVVISGRVGAAIASELGTMKVTEQIEALEAMSQDPMEFLTLPRVLAMTIMVPLLVGIADVAGWLGGFVVAFSSRINPYSYFHSTQVMLDVSDITGGLIKAAFFGFTIAIISCYYGLKTSAGAKGVGSATKRSVVYSLVSVFILNYFLSLVI